MALDANIPLQVQPFQIESPINRFAKYQQLATNKMAMDEQVAQVKERNALAELMQRNVNPNTPEGQNAILAAAPRTGPALLKSLAESRSAGVKARSEEFELKAKQIDKAVKDIAAYTTAEDTLAGIQRHLAAGDIDEAKATALVNALKSAPSFEAWQMNTLRGLLDAKDQLARTFTNQDLGGSTRQIATPTYGGGPAQVVEGSVGTKTMTPGDVQQAKDAAANRANQSSIAAANRANQLEIAKIGDARQERRLAAADTKLAQKEQMANEQRVATADVVMGKVDEALEQLPGLTTTGFTGGVTRNIPGSPAYQLDRTIDTIKANLGFDALAAMRAASPTGGALGQVAVQELHMLQAAVSSLDTAQNEKQLKKNLEAVKQHYGKIKEIIAKHSATVGGGDVDTSNPLLQ